jgi:hypothetical protein
MYVWMDGWMDGCMYVCMDGWMDGCMHACMYVCMYVCEHSHIEEVFMTKFGTQCLGNNTQNIPNCIIFCILLSGT